MRTEHRLMTCVVALVASLALAACGDVQQASGTLEVASVPKAQVAVDGTPHGTTPATIKLDAGRHEIVLSREHFEPQTQAIDLAGGESATVETVLLGTDPGDPEVIRALAEAFEIDYQPFEGVERHRGSRDRDEAAVLLWPQKDVRLEGLVTYGIEVSLDYMGDGYLVWKKSGKELARHPFTPKKVMTVSVIPTEVREAVKTGSTITWGLVFDDRRKPVTTKFKIVKNSKVDKAIAKLERRKYFKRQPPLTQALMRAQVLHNHRLYTESLLAHLGVVQEFPTSVQPYEGIVTALRRMDGDASELWTLASQHVSGKGGHGRANMPGNSGFGAAPTAGMGPTGSRPAMPGMGTTEIPLRLYDPRVETPTAPTVDQPGDTATTPQPGDTQDPASTDTSTQDPATGTGGLGTTTGRPTETGALLLRAEEIRTQADELRNLADAKIEQANAAREEFLAAEEGIREAEDTRAETAQAAEDARQAYQADQTPENEAALLQAEERAAEAEAAVQSAEERLNALGKLAEKLQAEAEEAEAEAIDWDEQAKAARLEADAAAGLATDPKFPPKEEPEPPVKTDPTIPTPDPVEPDEGPVLDQLRRDLGQVQNDLADARRELLEIEALAALNPDDTDLQAQVTEQRQRVADAEQAVGDIGDQYILAGGKHPPEMPEVFSGAAHQAQVEVLRRGLADAEQAVTAAEVVVADAQQALVENPNDDAAIAAFEAAQAALDAAFEARDAASEALQAAEKQDR